MIHLWQFDFHLQSKHKNLLFHLNRYYQNHQVKQFHFRYHHYRLLFGLVLRWLRVPDLEYHMLVYLPVGYWKPSQQFHYQAALPYIYNRYLPIHCYLYTFLHLQAHQLNSCKRHRLVTSCEYGNHFHPYYCLSNSVQLYYNFEPQQ